MKVHNGPDVTTLKTVLRKVTIQDHGVEFSISHRSTPG
jgi:hypothetical protein